MSKKIHNLRCISPSLGISHCKLAVIFFLRYRSWTTAVVKWALTAQFSIQLSRQRFSISVSLTIYALASLAVISLKPAGCYEYVWMPVIPRELSAVSPTAVRELSVRPRRGSVKLSSVSLYHLCCHNDTDTACSPQRQRLMTIQLLSSSGHSQQDNLQRKETKVLGERFKQTFLSILSF